jgi:hypothetical protein
LSLIVFFGTWIVPSIVFFLINAIEFGTIVNFPFTIIALAVVIVVIGDSMEHAPCLLPECVNLILEL